MPAEALSIKISALKDIFPPRNPSERPHQVSLDHYRDLAIVAHIYVGSKASWDTLPSPGARFDETPGLPELIRLLHEESQG